MYQCKTRPIDSRKTKQVIAEARRLIKKWRARSAGTRPYLRVKSRGLKGKVYIDDFHFHIDAKGYGDMIGRYRLVPCVIELLRKTHDEPLPTKRGNLMFEGTTPDGQRFKVIVRPEKQGGCLQSFYPS